MKSKKKKKMPTEVFILYVGLGASIMLSLINGCITRQLHKSQMQLWLKNQELSYCIHQCGIDHAKIWDDIYDINLSTQNKEDNK